MCRYGPIFTVVLVLFSGSFSWSACGIFSTPNESGLVLAAGQRGRTFQRSPGRAAPKGTTIQLRDKKGNMHDLIIFDEGFGAEGFHAWARSRDPADMEHFKSIDRPITPVRKIDKGEMSWSGQYLATISERQVYIWQITERRPHGGRKPFSVIEFPESGIRPERVLLINGYFWIVLNNGIRVVMDYGFDGMKGARFEGDEVYARRFLVEPFQTEKGVIKSDLDYTFVSSFNGTIIRKSADVGRVDLAASVFFDSGVTPVKVKGKYRLDRMKDDIIPIQVEEAEIELPNGTKISNRDGDVNITFEVDEI